MSDALGRMDGEMNNLREELIMWQQSADAETTIADAEEGSYKCSRHSNASALASMRRVKASEDRVKEVQNQMTKKTVSWRMWS